MTRSKTSKKTPVNPYAWLKDHFNTLLFLRKAEMQHYYSFRNNHPTDIEQIFNEPTTKSQYKLNRAFESIPDKDLEKVYWALLDMEIEDKFPYPFIFPKEIIILKARMYLRIEINSRNMFGYKYLVNQPDFMVLMTEEKKQAHIEKLEAIEKDKLERKAKEKEQRKIEKAQRAYAEIRREEEIRAEENRRWERNVYRVMVDQKTDFLARYGSMLSDTAKAELQTEIEMENEKC